MAITEVFTFSGNTLTIHNRKKAETIVIYRDSNDVIACDVSTGKSGKARCNPKDKFDFYTGAELAFQRLDESAFIPHLWSSFLENIGIIGQPTDIKDIFGNSLRVGDTVNLLCAKNGQLDVCGERSVVEGEEGPFVMGMKGADFRNGIASQELLSSQFVIILKRRYEDIKDGESVGVIKYIKTVERRGK